MTTLLISILSFATGWLLAKHEPDYFKKLFRKLELLFEKFGNKN